MIHSGARRCTTGLLIERYKIAATVVNESVDPTFRFMTLDWDGKIRMDCSSPYAMERLVRWRGSDLAFANDTDTDRHGIVCPSVGLMNPNYYLAAAIAYLYLQIARTGADRVSARPSSVADDRSCRPRRSAQLLEVPVGFKWFAAGLRDGSLGFRRRRECRRCFLRQEGRSGHVDKDGLIMGLLAAEMTARLGKDPSRIYGDVTGGLGISFYERSMLLHQRSRDRY